MRGRGDAVSDEFEPLGAVRDGFAGHAGESEAAVSRKEGGGGPVGGRGAVGGGEKGVRGVGGEVAGEGCEIKGRGEVEGG